ncbi:MAG: hypothetical protein CME64_00930 [Halobacteriovoraceae bacterium]|nr:hypothetical protein [Halobacteriovoraceae bacterium]|tara:strand:+ start:204013 stop:205044 length:1032 start_codon:yes stop_codon:yes gene_type:complete
MRPSENDKNYEWPDYKRDFEALPPEKLFSNNRSVEMSAASKYDYLFGDQNTIFNKEIDFADSVYNRHNRISHWFGICHGTAIASFSYPEPVKGVTVKAFNNSDLHFTSIDIKRLAAYVWAENQKQSFQVGGRCYSNELGSREAFCLDTNPATFHLSLLNYIGVYGKTFIIDNAYDSMVWNRPVLSFRYKYKNPLTKLPSNKLKYSLLKLENYVNDPKAKFRAKDAFYIVEVEMTVELLYGDKDPKPNRLDSAYKINYSYDLEIDRNGNIIGGEWITKYHPDFTWMIKEGTSPSTTEDIFLKDFLWDGKTPLDYYVRSLGKQAAKKGKVLEYIVRSLIELTKEK